MTAIELSRHHNRRARESRKESRVISCGRCIQEVANDRPSQSCCTGPERTARLRYLKTKRVKQMCYFPLNTKISKPPTRLSKREKQFRRREKGIRTSEERTNENDLSRRDLASSIGESQTPVRHLELLARTNCRVKCQTWTRSLLVANTRNKNQKKSGEEEIRICGRERELYTREIPARTRAEKFRVSKLARTETAREPDVRST